MRIFPKRNGPRDLLVTSGHFHLFDTIFVTAIPGGVTGVWTGHQFICQTRWRGYNGVFSSLLRCCFSWLSFSMELFTFIPEPWITILLRISVSILIFLAFKWAGFWYSHRLKYEYLQRYFFVCLIMYTVSWKWVQINMRKTILKLSWGKDD